MSDQKQVFMSFFEDSDENIHFLYNSKDSVIGNLYPSKFLTNDAGYKFARVLLCTHLDQVPETPIRMHEEFKIHFFSTSQGKTYSNSSITVALDLSTLNKKAISDTVNCTCSAGKVNSLGEKDSEHAVFVTQEEYTDNNTTKYAIGVWVDITGFEYITIEPLSSMAFNNMPIHIDHLDSWYVSSYIDNSTKSNDANLKNIETQITQNQIGYGVYDSDFSKAMIEKILAKLDNVPDSSIQNSVYYTNTYIPGNANEEETITPYSIRGTFSEKVVSIDTANKSFRVLKSGTYQLQLRNGFYLSEGEESQLEMIVYKNSDSIKELGMQSYLVGGKKDFRSSNVALIHLTTSDAITLKLIWADANVTVGADTFMTISPVQYD